MRRRSSRRSIPPIAIVLSTLLLACATAHSPTTTPSNKTTTTRAHQLARRFIQRHPPGDLAWTWESAIFTYALARLDQVDDSPDWLAYLTAYYQAHPAPRVRRPDDCAPALAAALLVQRGHPVAAHSPATQVADYLRTTPRNSLGALDHLDPRTPLGRLYPPSIWVDSLVMYALTAARLGRALDDPDLLAFAHAQPVIFATHLQDPATGLFRHAYLYERHRTRPEDPVFWLRGNGWVAFALVELLETMDPDQPEFLAARVILGRLAEGLTRHRTSAGTWTTVIDAPRTYEETSGTALVAYALAKGARLGLLPAHHRHDSRQTLQTLDARLRARRDGLALPDTSGPTIPSRRSGYAVVPRRADVPYGVGAYLLLVAELTHRGPSSPRARAEPHGHIGSMNGS